MQESQCPPAWDDHRSPSLLGHAQLVIGGAVGVTVVSLCLLLLLVTTFACCLRGSILQGEVCGRWGGAGTLCHLPHFLLCFSDRKSLLSTLQIPLFSSDLALTPFPVIPPPCPTSPLQGWDHISGLVSRLTVTSSSWPSLGGQDQLVLQGPQSEQRGGQSLSRKFTLPLRSPGRQLPRGRGIK